MIIAGGDTGIRAIRAHSSGPAVAGTLSPNDLRQPFTPMKEVKAELA
jgi:hypothetical protein